MKSVLLEKHIRDVFNFIRFVKTGPASANSQSKDCIKYYIPHSPHFLCQPALCRHSVITFTTGPSLVLGWEACDKADIKRAQQTLQYYGNGLRNSAYKRLLEIQGLRGAVEWGIKRDTSSQTSSGITEHLVALNHSIQPILITNVCLKRGRPSAPSKERKRSFRLPKQQLRFEEKKEQEFGNN